ncbi:hypothetical protein CB0940_02417 [Cercospora beticola]|uniref:Rhodopsin domain-containing protein n=1 Tax=Cercospora beticola TaxID=122368 RepID=A0A2G5I529_CERBT|nr:hypothetical protein CB0940_02417 [Cercospora beticola]PIA99602.1 hypothetical protein CB0940_02417 [Cercospora beticola]WPA99551.1 hypothetical protein RHO25_004169 [Cercospora beticola]
MTSSAAGIDSQRIGIFTTVAISLSAVWISLSLRAWTRITVTKNLGRDDAFLLGATLLFTGYCMTVILMMLATNGGAFDASGKHSTLPAAAISMVISSFGLYISTMIVLKVSLTFFFLRLLTRAWQRWIVIGIVTGNAIYGIIVFSSMLFSCGGPERYLSSDNPGRCLPPRTNYILQLEWCIVNGVTNWMFVILPVLLLIRVPMTLVLKLCTGLVLFLASCASIVSLVRIRYIGNVKPGPELFVTAVNLCICTIAECGLGITAASIATLRPLFRRLDDPGFEPIASPPPHATTSRRMIASSFYSTYIDGYYGTSDTPRASSSPKFISRFSHWSTSSVDSPRPKQKSEKAKRAEKALSIKTPHREMTTPPVPAVPQQQLSPPPTIFRTKSEKGEKVKSKPLKSESRAPPLVRKISAPLPQVTHQQPQSVAASYAQILPPYPLSSHPAGFDHTSAVEDHGRVAHGWV